MSFGELIGSYVYMTCAIDELQKCAHETKHPDNEKHCIECGSIQVESGEWVLPPRVMPLVVALKSFRKTTAGDQP